MMPLSKEAVTLLRRVKRMILAEPKQFVMSQFTTSYVSKHSSDLKRKLIPNCHTAACIAGWAVALANKQSPRAVEEEELRSARSIGSIAVRVLGLAWSQADGLFYTSGWPTSLQREWYATKTLKGRAAVAARSIEAFIKEHSQAARERA